MALKYNCILWLVWSSAREKYWSTTAFFGWCGHLQGRNTGVQLHSLAGVVICKGEILEYNCILWLVWSSAREKYWSTTAFFGWCGHLQGRNTGVQLHSLAGVVICKGEILEYNCILWLVWSSAREKYWSTTAFFGWCGHLQGRNTGVQLHSLAGVVICKGEILEYNCILWLVWSSAREKYWSTTAFFGWCGHLQGRNTGVQLHSLAGVVITKEE